LESGWNKKDELRGRQQGKPRACTKGMDIFHIIPYELSLNTRRKLGKRRSDARFVNKGRPPNPAHPSSLKNHEVQG